MAFLAFGTSDVLDGHAIHFTGFLNLYGISRNACRIYYHSLESGSSLSWYGAIDTPAHAHVCKLLHFIHFLDRTHGKSALSLPARMCWAWLK